MRLEGEVLLSRPLRAHALISLLAASMLALAVWITTGSYARTEVAKGQLVTNAQTAKIIALHPGIVTRIAVADGEAVRKGQVLATIQIDQPYAQDARATQEGLNSLRVQQQLRARLVNTARQRGLSERLGYSATIESSSAQYDNVVGEVAIQSKLLQTLENTYQRYRSVAEKGFISQVEMEKREREILVGRQQLARLQQQLLTLRNNGAQAAAQIRKSQAEEEAEVSSARISAEGLRAQQSQLKAQQSYVLIAPIDGVVTALQVGVGQTADASVPLMTLVPRQAVVHAEVYAPSRAIGFVRPGQEVRLLYDAFPYQRFGSFKGVVQSVSRIALDPRQVNAPFKIDEPVYRVSVVPQQQQVGGYGELIRLQPGMTLAANIVLERRSFLHLILEPLSAVAKRDR